MLCSVHGQNPSTDTTEREREGERGSERERERERERATAARSFYASGSYRLSLGGEGQK